MVYQRASHKQEAIDMRKLQLGKYLKENVRFMQADQNFYLKKKIFS